MYIITQLSSPISRIPGLFKRFYIHYIHTYTYITLHACILLLNSLLPSPKLKPVFPVDVLTTPVF